MTETHTRQVYESQGDKRRRLTNLLSLLVILIAVLFIVLAGINKRYKPPKHEPNAVSGIPVVEEHYLYNKADTEFGYSFSMAANLYRQEDGSLNIYLTNPSANEVLLLCKIFDAENDTLYYESGYLEPGEYVENLPCATDFENVYHDVRVKIYAYHPATYTSEGTTELKIALQPW